jgi:hypothetical protein
MEVMLSALRTGRTLLPRNIIFLLLILISVRDWVKDRALEESAWNSTSVEKGVGGGYSFWEIIKRKHFLCLSIIKEIYIWSKMLKFNLRFLELQSWTQYIYIYICLCACVCVRVCVCVCVIFGRAVLFLGNSNTPQHIHFRDTAV